MGSNAIVGALQVVLGADTAALDQGLKDAQSSLAKFGAGMSKVGVAAAASFGAVGVAMAAAMKGAIDKADEIGKAAQKIGVPVEELSALKHAADLSDVSMETLTTSMGKLAKNMSAVAGGAQGEAAEAFKAMGISVANTDGTLRSSSQVLGELAGKFAGYEDGAAKSALAMSVFGRSGAQMIPLLNAGATGLRDMADEAARLGLVMSKETTDAAQEVNDNFTRMRAVGDGLVTQVTARMLPAFQGLSQILVDAAKNTTLMTTAADGLAFTLRTLVSGGVIVGAVFKSAWEALANLFGSLGELVKGNFAAAAQKFGDVGQSLIDNVSGTVSTIDKLWTDGTAKMAATSEATGPKISAPIIQAAGASTNAMSQFFASQAKRIAGMTAEAQTIGLSVGAHEKLRVQLEAEALAKEKNIPLTDALAQKIAATGEAAAMAAMRIHGAQVTLQAMSPAQQFEMDLTRLKELYDAGAISLETFGARQQQIAEQASATWGIAGASIAGSFAKMAGAFAKESKGMATAAKIFGVIQATISMFTGAAKALELPFPANLAAMASVLAQGASLVASIKSQAIPTGMMTGGALTVRGAGGPDSVPVQFMASPGEQVDVWRPDQGGGTDPRRGAGGQTVINVGVPIVTTREAVRDLFELINDALGDGHVLKLRPV